MSRTQMLKLFHFATAQTHFLFNDQYYDQVDGVAMGSPLGPVLANLFMGFHEKNWLSEYDGPRVMFYRRYVDDIFCIFEHQDHVAPFLSYLNKQHTNINFTVEHETGNNLPFLDVLVTKHDNAVLGTTTYRKPTNTGLLTNYTSFTAFTYKIGLVRTLLDRVFKINSDTTARNNDLKHVTRTLQKNMFPMNLINQVIGKFTQHYQQNSTNCDTNTPTATIPAPTVTPRYYKLPYIGTYSDITKAKVKDLIVKYCNEKVNVKIIFNTCKISQYFSNKDRIPNDLMSHVVYKFICPSCNAGYIGETARHLSTRAHEHMETDKNSSVYKHLRANPACKQSCDITSFSILDRATTAFQLQIKEALQIKKVAPVLNRQVRSYQVKLLV